MGEPMAAWVEVWPLAADETGIWLLSGGDAWRTGPVPADSDPLFEVKLLVGQHHPEMQLDLIHSTSWRVDGPSVILTCRTMAGCTTRYYEAGRKGRKAYYARGQ